MFLGTIENDILEEKTVNPKSKMAAAAILDLYAYDKKTPSFTPETHFGPILN